MYLVTFKSLKIKFVTYALNLFYFFQPFVAGVLLDNATPSVSSSSRLATSYGTMSGATNVNQENDEINTNGVHYVQ